MKVLLADDEQSIRVTLGDALTKGGHQVVLAATGAECAAWATRHYQPQTYCGLAKHPQGGSHEREEQRDIR